MFVEIDRTTLIYCAVLGSVAAGVTLASTSRSNNRIPLEMLAVPALFAGLTLLVAVHNIELVVVVLVPFVTVVFAILLRSIFARSQPHARSVLSLEYLAAAGISASLLAACVFGLWLSEQGNHAYITGGFVLTIVGAVLGGVFLPYFKADYEHLMQVEGDTTIRQPDGLPSPEQTKAAAAAWPRLAGYAVAAFTSMLVLTIALGPSLGWQRGQAHPNWRPLGLAALALVLCLIPTVPALRQAFEKHPANGPRRSPTRQPSTVWWCFVGGIAVCGILLSTLLRDGGFQAYAAVQSLLITAFAVHSIAGNAAWLNLSTVGRIPRLTISAVAAAVLTTVYWSLTVGLRPSGSPASTGAAIVAWFIAALMVVFLVEATAATVYVAGGRPYRTDYSPGRNVAQDSFHLIILWFVLGWFPQFVLTSVPASNSERWAAIGTILAGFLLLFGPAFLWVLENNDTHVERQRRINSVPATGALGQLANASSSIARIGTLPNRVRELARSVRHPEAGPSAEAQKFLVRLNGHTAVQNTLALILAAISAIGVIGISAGLSQHATGLDSLPIDN
jgi:hypothetical protein